jgi:S-adenosylmethionine hydrolase
MTSPVSEFILNPDYFPIQSKDGIEAKIVYIDKFGNLMTHVTETFLLDALEKSGMSTFKVEFNGREIKEFYETYGRAETGPFMLIGSHQNLEIAINQASAASALDAQIGQKVLIKFY